MKNDTSKTSIHERSRLPRLCLGITALIVAITGCNNETQPSVAADAVYLNGNIYTSDPSMPRATAIAVSDGKIVYVGDDPAANTGPGTIVHDLEGRAMIPGLIDAHSHPGWVALSSNVMNLEDTTSKESLMKSIGKMVAEHPDREVLIGGFWPNEFFDVSGPTLHELDAIESNRPVIIFDAWAHTIWVNSKALERAGVNRDTADVVPGFAFYQRDEAGDATGWITESAATVFTNKFQSVTSDVERVLLEYLEYYRDIGVTTVLDAGNFGLDREIYAVISRLDQEGRLPIRYHGTYTLFVPDDWPNAVATLKKLGEDFNSENVRIDTLKLYYDGVLETRTANLSQDYLDTPGNSGAALLSPQQVHDLILQLDAEGLHLHMHAVGDLATTKLLDAIEAAHESLGRPPRIRITVCHLEVVREADIPRFAQLGVIANFTPHWWSGGDVSWVARGVGEKVSSMQRGQTFVEAGAVVSFSSDITDRYEWKTDRANPFLGMQMAHNRQEAAGGEDADVFPPISDRVNRYDMLRGYSSNAAFQMDREHEFGSLSVGKSADLLVLNQDPIEVNRYDIYTTRPTAVIVRGEVVSGSLSE